MSFIIQTHQLMLRKHLPMQATYNKGFHQRKLVLGTTGEVNCEIPLNRHSFFESLEDKLLPNTRIDLNIEFDSDNNLFWPSDASAEDAGNNYRFTEQKLRLFIPKLIFHSERQELCMDDYLKPYKWVHLNEVIHPSNISRQKTGHFRITNGISKPWHVFVFLINNEKINKQKQNQFIYDTFNVVNNQKLVSCYLEAGNGNEYPDIHYKPKEDPSRVCRDVMSYVYANNDFQGGTLLNRANFKNVDPFVDFDLTKHKIVIKDGVTKLAFHYELEDVTNNDYFIYALVLHEREAKIEQQGGKLLLQA